MIIYALYLILTGLVAPYAGKRIAQKSLTDVLGRNTQIGAITFNPFTLEARVKNFNIQSKVQGENLASIQLIYVNLSAASLFHLAPIISGVQITSPHFSLHLNKDNTLNISDLLGKDKEGETAPEKKETSSLFEFKVANVKIEDGALIFTDHLHSVTHIVEQLNLDLPLVSTMKKDLPVPITAVLNCLVNKAGLELNLSGTPFDISRKMAVSLKTQPLDLNPLAAYVDLPRPYKIKSAGNLALSLSGAYEIPAGKNAADQTLSVSLNTQISNMDMESVAGAPLLSCPRILVDASSDNVFTKKFLVNQIALDHISLFVERDEQGRINLVPQGTSDKAPESPSSQSDNPQTKETRMSVATDASQAAAAIEDTTAMATQAKAVSEAEANTISNQTAGSDAAQTQPGPVQNQAQNQVQSQDPNAAPDQNPEHSPAPLISFTLPVSVKIRQAAVNDMHIRFNDRAVSPEVVKEISDLDVILTDVEIGPEIAGTLDLHILTGDAEEVKAAAGFTLDNALSVDGSFALSGLAMEKYRSYLTAYLGDNITLENLGTSLNFKVGLSGNSLDVKVTDGSITLDKFNLTEQGKETPVVRFEQLGLSQISCDLSGKQAGVGLVALRNAEVRISRDKSGTMDLLTAIEQAVKKSENSPDPDSAEKSSHANGKNQESEAASSSPWTAVVNKTVLEQCRVEFIDNAAKEPVDIILADMGVTVENISTKEGENANFTASMTNKNKGKINLDGSFDISGPSATVNVDINRIDVNTAEPYFTDFLKISISKGYLNTKGAVALIPVKDKDAPPTITFKGSVSLNDFLSKNKVDDTEFFSCKSLYADGMDISVNPMKVAIREVALTDFYQQAILNNKGELNFKQVMVEKPADDKAAAGKTDKNKTASQKTAENVPDIRIDSITLQGGHINFSDYFTKPNFTSNMTQIAGSLTGLSSRGKEHARLALKGVHGGHAPLDITGQLDPLKNSQFVDLTVSFKNIELPRFSAYSGKYLGREIQKGKLILDLHYNIDGDKLNSSNRAIFDQLTLGKKVESENATSLPLDLALSLLKDTKGQINLDLPIDGDMSDPTFHFGKVLGTVLKNFVTSVVTQPFKFLGGLVGIGSGQDLGFVTFDPGAGQLDQTQKEKLDKLAMVLNKKPDLKLEILGQYNKVNDAEQLRQGKYEKLILSMDTTGSREGDTKLADIPEEERNFLIEAAYEAATFLKPRDESGNIKEVSLTEKEKLLVTSMPVDEGELNDLALQRSSGIIEYLTATGGIDTGRLFVTDPEAVSDAEENSRQVKATFTLK